MKAIPTSKVWTWQEALELPNGDRYEVMNGELKERCMSFRSSAIAGVIVELLRRWSRAGHPGTVAQSDGGLTIFPWAPGDVRMPDVSYISKERLPRVPEKGWLDVPPELAVEVVSPNDTVAAMEDKAQDYIRAGVQLVWVVVPSTQAVHVWWAAGHREILVPGDSLTGRDILPGFEVAVDDLFAEFED
jgi:Uma2 family endonuclease